MNTHHGPVGEAAQQLRFFIEVKYLSVHILYGAFNNVIYFKHLNSLFIASERITSISSFVIGGKASSTLGDKCKLLDIKPLL